MQPHPPPPTFKTIVHHCTNTFQCHYSTAVCCICNPCSVAIAPNFSCCADVTPPFSPQWFRNEVSSWSPFLSIVKRKTRTPYLRRKRCTKEWLGWIKKIHTSILICIMVIDFCITPWSSWCMSYYQVKGFIQTKDKTTSCLCVLSMYMFWPVTFDL